MADAWWIQLHRFHWLIIHPSGVWALRFVLSVLQTAFTPPGLITIDQVVASAHVCTGFIMGRFYRAAEWLEKVESQDIDKIVLDYLSWICSFVCSLRPAPTTVKHRVQKHLKSIFKGFIFSLCSQEELMKVFPCLRRLSIIACRLYSL